MNYNNWEDFFKKCNFTFFRTSLIQKKYIETINKYAQQFDWPVILEIAGGSGYTSAVVADLIRDKGEVFLTDLSEEMMNLSNKYFKSMTNLYGFTQDASKLSQFLPCRELSKIDIIIHQGFLEHFSDQEIIHFLKEQAGVASIIIFDVPNSIRNDLTQEFGNERFLSPKQWEDLVKKSGLKIIERTGRRFNNWWKKFVPISILESNWFAKKFGESTIIVCGK